MWPGSMFQVPTAGRVAPTMVRLAVVVGGGHEVPCSVELRGAMLRCDSRLHRCNLLAPSAHRVARSRFAAVRSDWTWLRTLIAARLLSGCRAGRRQPSSPSTTRDNANASDNQIATDLAEPGGMHRPHHLAFANATGPVSAAAGHLLGVDCSFSAAGRSSRLGGPADQDVLLQPQP